MTSLHLKAALLKRKKNVSVHLNKTLLQINRLRKKSIIITIIESNNGPSEEYISS